VLSAAPLPGAAELGGELDSVDQVGERTSNTTASTRTPKRATV
jgi:hypothetical protein